MNWKDWVNVLRILAVGGAVVYLARRLTREQHRAERAAARPHPLDTVPPEHR